MFTYLKMFLYCMLNMFSISKSPYCSDWDRTHTTYWIHRATKNGILRSNKYISEEVLQVVHWIVNETPNWRVLTNDDPNVIILQKDGIQIFVSFANDRAVLNCGSYTFHCDVYNHTEETLLVRTLWGVLHKRKIREVKEEKFSQNKEFLYKVFS